MKNKNDSFNDLFNKITQLLELYKKTLNKSVEVFDDIEMLTNDEEHNSILKDDLFDFLDNAWEGKLLIRLIIALQYVGFPEEKKVIDNLTRNIFENNVDSIENINDLDNLFNFDVLTTELLKRGIIGDSYEEDFEDELDEELDDLFVPKKKRLLH